MIKWGNMRNWVKRSLLTLLSLLLVGSGIFYYRWVIWIKMSPDLVSKANAALAKGITIEDPQNDFLNKDLLGKEMDLEKSYTLPYMDIKSLSVGMDDKYFYYKTSVWGTIPKKPGQVNGDYIVGCGPQLSLLNDKRETQATLAAEYGWQPIVHIYSVNTWYATCPSLPLSLS